MTDISENLLVLPGMHRDEKTTVANLYAALGELILAGLGDKEIGTENPRATEQGILLDG